MVRHLTLLVLVACSSKGDAPEPTPAPALALSFVPAEIANQLAGAHFVAAINVDQADLTPAFELLPSNAACVRDLVESIGVAVLVTGKDASDMTAFATKLPEPATRACLDQLIPAMGGSTRVGERDLYEVRFGDDKFSLAWKDGIVTARSLESRPVRRGAPSPEMRALIGDVPATSTFFFLLMATPERKLKSLLGWGHIAEDTLQMQLRAEGTERGVVRPWLQEFIDGFNEAAEEKQIPVDYGWFNGTLNEPVGTIEGRIPLSVFRTYAERR